MKKTLAIVLALMMLVSVFAVQAFAADEGTATVKPITAYEMLMGEELGHKLFNGEDELWDWTGSDGPNNPNWLNLGADSKWPAVRIQTIYVPETVTYAEGTKIAINWYLVKGNLHQAICLNYDLGTGVLEGANYDFLSVVDYSAPVSEENRTGYIQFITTLDPAGIEKTYANGELVLQRHTHDGAGSAIFGVAYQFRCMNNDTTGFGNTSPAYMPAEGEAVETVNILLWSSTQFTAVNDSLVAGLYNAFANYYGKQVKWYPQDEVKNGLVIGAGGIRYYVDGEYQTGWVDGRYFLKETGYMVTENRTIGGCPYVVNADCTLTAVDGEYGDYYYVNGEKVTGWIDTDGDGVADQYRYLETGLKCTSTRKIGGLYCEYNARTDVMSLMNDWLDEGDDTFYIVDGVKATGWQNIDGDWYYFYKETGVMVCDITRTVGGVLHTFDADGICEDYEPVVEEPEEPVEELDAFAGTWKTSRGGTIVFDGKGGLVFGDYTGTYTVEGNVASFTFGYDPYTCKLTANGGMDIEFEQDYETYSMTATKQ